MESKLFAVTSVRVVSTVYLVAAENREFALDSVVCQDENILSNITIDHGSMEAMQSIEEVQDQNEFENLVKSKFVDQNQSFLFNKSQDKAL